MGRKRKKEEREYWEEGEDWEREMRKRKESGKGQKGKMKKGKVKMIKIITTERMAKKMMEIIKRRSLWKVK